MAFTNPLTPARLAAAIASTTLTVTGQVTTTNPTTTDDEDIMRVMTQAQIDGLSAADKATNFVIWNTTTSTVNYCVGNNIVVPPAAPTVKTPVFGTVQVPALSLTYNSFQTVTLNLPSGYTKATFTISGASIAGLQFTVGADSTTVQVTGNYNSSNPTTFAVTSATQNINITLNGQGSGQGAWIRNVKYTSSSGALTFEIAANNANFSTAAGNVFLNYALD